MVEWMFQPLVRLCSASEVHGINDDACLRASMMLGSHPFEVVRSDC